LATRDKKRSVNQGNSSGPAADGGAEDDSSLAGSLNFQHGLLKSQSAYLDGSLYAERSASPVDTVFALLSAHSISPLFAKPDTNGRKQIWFGRRLTYRGDPERKEHMFSSGIARAVFGVGSILVLACGCRHCGQEQSCSTCGSAPVMSSKAAMIMPTPPGPVASMPAMPPAKFEPLSIPAVASEKYVPPEKGIVIAQKPALDEAVVTPKTTEEPKEAANGSLADWNKVVVVQRRNFADITARSEFDHASDHSWLVGSLNYVPQKQQWRLRYTSIDDEDKYGGSVTLDVGPQMMKPYHEGDLVRVQGGVEDPDSRQPSPTYRVRSIDVLSK
jgi:hypothetical protein